MSSMSSTPDGGPVHALSTHASSAHDSSEHGPGTRTHIHEGHIDPAGEVGGVVHSGDVVIKSNGMHITHIHR